MPDIIRTEDGQTIEVSGIVLKGNPTIKVNIITRDRVRGKRKAECLSIDIGSAAMISAALLNQALSVTKK